MPMCLWVVSSSVFLHAVLICLEITAWIRYCAGEAQWSVMYFGKKGEKIGFLVLLIAYLWILCTVCMSSHQWLSLWIWLCSLLYISPPQLCHTFNSTVGMLSSAGGSCRAALGSINFIAYFYNLPLCMHPPSHLIASALTVHTAVKFYVSPCFMVACSSSHSQFLYLLL